MNKETLKPKTLSLIDEYKNFTVGGAVCPIPYFNNKTKKRRGALRAFAGKGSPSDIREEVETILTKENVLTAKLDSQLLKKILVDNNLGIDCSGFAYYVLNTESIERGLASVEKTISFINCRGLIGKIRCHFRPVHNCDVSTLASDKNSKIISLGDVMPGDIITMIGDTDESEHDHILIIYSVEKNSSQIKINYVHAIAYPEDGLYGSSIREGIIEISDPLKPITEASWRESDKTDSELRILARAMKSQTQLRRPLWFDIVYA